MQHPGLSFADGKVSIYKEVPEDVSVLLGSTKDFQHYIIKQGRGNNLKMPQGMFMMVFLEKKLIGLISAKLSFIWANNKLALIEEESNQDYRAFQYHIEEGWKVLIGKNENTGPSEPTWSLFRIKGSEGSERKLLQSVRQFYQRSNEHNPRRT